MTLNAAALVLSGFAVSLGLSARPVTAPLTYDPRLAAQGGRVFACPARACDEEALRMSKAVVLASGGLSSPAAALAREHGVPAVVLSGARWENGRLVVEAPTFGAAERQGGFAFEPAVASSARPVEEGEAVTVSAAAGSLALYPPEVRREELDLAQALDAYAGLRDGQALIQWWQARSGEPDAAALAARLCAELAERSVDGEARAEDAVALARAAGVQKELARAAAQASTRARGVLAGLRRSLAQATSAEAAQTLSRRVEHACGALQALAARQAACAADLAFARTRAQSLAGRPARPWLEAAQAAGASARPGQAIGAAEYGAFVASGGLGPKIDDTASDASLPLALKSARIAALFSSAGLPAAPAGAGPFDVDCEGASRQDVAKAGMPKAIVSCWAAFWAPGPLGRRKRAGITGAMPRIFVSPSLSGGVSGEVYSREPGGAADRVYVSAAGDQYLVNGEGAPLMAPILAGERPALSPSELARLARLARAVESDLGQPVAVSFAFQGQALYASAARPFN